MTHRTLVIRWLAAAWIVAAAAAQAGRITTAPSQPSSRDTIRITFFEDDWFDSCPPVFQGVTVDGHEITVRAGLEPDTACIALFLHNPYTIVARVGPLLPGSYRVRVEAPDDSSGEIEVSTAVIEVVKAVQCEMASQPAATVLLPYFEVDVEDPDGRDTLFSVSTVELEPTLAHAVLWTNWGQPVLSFDFFLPAGGTRTFDVRDLLQGRLPTTSPPSDLADFPPGSWESCTVPLTSPEVDGDALTALFTGRPHPEDGLCYSGAVEDGRLATGYITVDVVRDCSGGELVTPWESDYFVDGGQGLATNDNVLRGDFFLVDSANDFAQGESLVSVVADAARFGSRAICDPEPCPDRISTTFYGSSSNRMPLPRTYRSRFLNGGTFTGGTDLVLWMEGSTEPAECGFEAPQTFYMVLATFRNEAGEGEPEHTFQTPEHVLRLGVGGDRLPTGESFGLVDVSALFFNGIIGVPLIEELQVWAMPVLSASGRFSLGTSAVPIADFCR